MKILFFLIVYFINKISSDYEKFDLTYKSPAYYISLNFPDQEVKSNYLLSTKIPKSFFPTTECLKCKQKIIESPNSTYLNSSKNISIPYYYYNFIGKELNGTIHTQNYTSEETFCGFDNFTYLQKYDGRGMFALSFLHYNFSTEKKLFALKFADDKTELHLGDYDQSTYDIQKANNFHVTIEEIYENYTEQIIHENETDAFYNDNNLLFENNNYLSEQNDSNDSYIENITIEIDKSRWYIDFPSLKIKTDTEMDVDYPNNSFKLTLDIGVNRFFIPKLFFEKNVNKFFPKESNCQLSRSGYFVCDCDEDYKTKFGSFVFEANGTKFYVNVTDYMTYQSSITGSVCEVHIVINYDNDMFIGGNSVLNNYYSIFDVENNMIRIIEENNLSGKETKKFLILFFVVLFGSILLLFGGYFLYNKYIINEPSGLVPENNNNNNNDNIHQNDNNIEPN